MILDMFEVNCGEAILMTEEEHQLPVDCGAKFGRRGKTAAVAVQGQLTQIHKKALVTHFDEDHYNGLIELAGQVQLDHIYLPRYKYSKGVGVEETEGYLNQVVTAWCYQRLIKQNKKLDALQRLLISLTRLVGSRDQVSCVEKGNQVNCGPKVWNVLWPETKDSSLQRYVQELENIVCTGERWRKVQQTVNRYTQALLAVYAIYAERHNDYSFGNLNQAEYQELEESYQQLIRLSVDVAIGPTDNKRMNGIF